MTKEDVIKRAYGEFYEICQPNENGWSLNKDLKFWNMFKHHPEYTPARFRPVELKEIENNNGWIKIESENDLPKESSLYWIKQSDGLIQTLKEYELNKEYYNIKPTHYQKIIKPETPIY